jgi:hypothetical protein
MNRITGYVAVLSLVLCSCVTSAAALTFSELLPNPAGADNTKEYVELLGDENLTGCTLSDASSSDTLQLVQHTIGSTVVLIVEEESAWLPIVGPTIYSAGSAIGNGLGNSADELQITCDNVTLASTAYNISLIEGATEGFAIYWNDTSGSWYASEAVTPGLAETSAQELPASVTITTTAATRAGGSAGALPACNSTLWIDAPTTVDTPEITFTITSPILATFAVTQGDETIAEGDTFTFATQTIAVPTNGTAKITATMLACGGRQRMTKIVHVNFTADAVAVLNTTLDARTNLTPTNLGVAQNQRLQLDTVESLAAGGRSDLPSQPSAMAGSAGSDAALVGAAATGRVVGTATGMAVAEQESHKQEPHISPSQTGDAQIDVDDHQIIVDDNISVIKWVSVFGAITLVGSAIAFMFHRD